MTAVCRDCTARFEPQGAWQKLCWDCWRDRRDTRACRHDAGQVTHPGLDAGLLRDLIALCHPDRHPAERAGLATQTTIRLLELRGSAR